MLDSDKPLPPGTNPSYFVSPVPLQPCLVDPDLMGGGDGGYAHMYKPQTPRLLTHGTGQTRTGQATTLNTAAIAAMLPMSDRTFFLSEDDEDYKLLPLPSGDFICTHHRVT